MMGEKMKEKIILISLIGQFLIIIVLGILVFNVKENTLKKCDKTNCSCKNEMKYTCLSNEIAGKNNTYQIKINITTDLKGKIIKNQKLNMYTYFDDEYYISMKKNMSDSEYSVDFVDDEKKIIIVSDDDINENFEAYLFYEEHLTSQGFSCSIVE